MKQIYLHMKREYRSTVFLFILLSVFAFVLQISYVMRNAGEEFHASIQENLNPRFVITTPFLEMPQWFDAENQIAMETDAMRELLKTLQNDRRVRNVFSEPMLHDGYLCTFEKIENDATMRGVVLCGSGERSQWNEKGRVINRSTHPPVIDEGEWAIVRQTQDVTQRYLDCIRLSLKGEATTFAFQRNPERFAFFPSVMEIEKGVVPRLLGVKTAEVNDQILDRLDIVEGRAIQPKEDQEQDTVIVAPWNAFIIDAKGYRPLQVGDRIPLSINAFGKLLYTEYYTVIGLHNGNTGFPFYIGENEYAADISKYCYLPVSRWTRLRDKLRGFYQQNAWQKQSHMGVDGRELENTRPAFDHETMTLPVIETRAFDDLPEVIAEIQPVLNRLNAMHEDKVYRCISEYETYQTLAGSIDSMRIIFHVMVLLGMFCTLIGLPFVLLMQIWQRRHETAIWQTLGKTKTETFFAIFLEYFFIATLAFFVSLLPTMLLSQQWKAYLVHSAGKANTPAGAFVSMEKMEALMETYLNHSIVKEIGLLFLLWIGLLAVACLLAYQVQKRRSLAASMKEE